MNTLYNQQELSTETNGIFTAQVFGWMTLGVFLTTIVAFIVNILALQSYQFYQVVSILYLPVFVFQLLILLIIGFLGRRVSTYVNIGLFSFFSLILGLTVGMVTVNYNISSIFIAFGVSSLMFLVLALFGYFTKINLSRF